jgi:hypothetical protein
VVQLDQTLRLSLYESRSIFVVQDVPPGVYNVPMATEGNSLLSTVWVKQLDVGAAVKVKYWDFGPGDGDTPGQRVDLQEHLLLNAADTTDRIIVTSLHNKPRAEITVTGGNVTFGVYVTVVATFASDLEANLKMDGQTATLLQDKGLPIVGYSAFDNKYYMLPIESGGVKVTGSITVGELTTSKKIKITGGAANTESTFTFPAQTKRFTLKARVATKILLADATGDIAAGDYLTIPAGSFYESQSFVAQAKAIYFQSAVANLEIEAEYWT